MIELRRRGGEVRKRFERCSSLLYSGGLDDHLQPGSLHSGTLITAVRGLGDVLEFRG